MFLQGSFDRVQTRFGKLSIEHYLGTNPQQKFGAGTVFCNIHENRLSALLYGTGVLFNILILADWPVVYTRIGWHIFVNLTGCQYRDDR